MGESQFIKTKLAKSCEQSLEAMSESMVVDTLGGRVMVPALRMKCYRCALTLLSTSLPMPCAIRTGAPTTVPQTSPNVGR